MGPLRAVKSIGNNDSSSGGLIPSDLYAEVPKFIDKKTLKEYMRHADCNTRLAVEGLFCLFFVLRSTNSVVVLYLPFSKQH